MTDDLVADFEDLPGETAADWFGGTNEDDRGNFWCGLWAGDGIVSIARMESEYDTDTVEHIARHDPARVLREVAAKRAIVDEHTLLDPPPDPDDPDWPLVCRRCEDRRRHDAMRWPCPTLRLLASVYADWPGYRAEWAPDEEVFHG